MNIQIFGNTKCFDTKKAERYFKEHSIKYQSIDMLSKGVSKGELRSIVSAVGSLELLINPKAKDQNTVMLIKYLAEEEREAKLLENPQILRTPIVRNGRAATVGYCPEEWKKWD